MNRSTNQVITPRFSGASEVIEKLPRIQARWLVGAASVLGASWTIGIAPAAAEPDKLLYDNLPAIELPPVNPDVLAKGHSFRLVGGGLNFVATGNASDSNEENDVSNYTLSANTRYFRSLELRNAGYSVLVDAGDSLTRLPARNGSEYDNQLLINALPEGRYYPTPDGQPVFFYGAGELELTMQTTKVTGTFAADANSIATGQVGLSFGIGFGRVIAIDPAVRLRRLEQALQREGLIAGAIPDDVGSDIIRTWYALRNQIGNYPRLAYTMQHLAKAGMLTEEPNLRATYKSILILQDPFIFDRRRGSQARLGLGVIKPFIGFDSAESPERSFAILGSAQHEKPISTVRQLSLRGQLFIDLGDTLTANREWSARGSLTHTHAFYTPTYDPTGMLTLSAEAGVSGLRTLAENGPSAGVDLVGRAVYTRVLDGGSQATFGGSLTARNDGEFGIAFSVGFTRGIAAGFYSPYSGGSQLQ